MKTSIWLAMLLAVLLPATAQCETGVLSREKAEMMGRVEDFFLHNFRDVTWRKSLEWGEVTTGDDGARTIRYTFEALIWDRDHLVISQDFTFDPQGEFVKFENVAGFPKKKVEKKVDTATREGLIDLVEDFFHNNYRDVTARKTLAWGKPSKDEHGNISISYKYEATIWNRNKKVMDQVFTFRPDGQFVSVKDAEAKQQENEQP